jgi:outer membrane biosynthesis protein TonB
MTTKYTANGNYLITVSMGDKEFSFPSKGYKVQSWMDFEASLNLKADVKEITLDKFHELHWTSTDLILENPGPPALPKVTKSKKVPKQPEPIPEPVAEKPKKTRKTKTQPTTKKTKTSLEDFL